jgi:hypothetical protein
MPAGVNLPAGHPDISAMLANGPSTQPQGGNGSMLIRAVQASQGGPAIGAEPFTVELYLRGQLFDKFAGKLDEKGTASVDGIPLRLNLEPVVKVTHGGAEYAAVGEILNPGVPRPVVQVAVYETTDKQPEWSVRMRHVMVERIAGGLQVMEMLAIDNPADRAWVGNQTADGKRTTFALSLPAEAQHVQVFGQHGSSARIEGNTLVNTGALVPGETQYQIVYQLPATDGKAEIAVKAPAAVKSLMVFLPDDGTTVKAQGVEAMGSSDMGKGKMRFYRGAELAAGQEVKIAISGIVEALAAAPASSLASGSTHAAQIVAGAGAAVILLFGIVFVMLKAPRGAGSAAK